MKVTGANILHQSKIKQYVAAGVVDVSHLSNLLQIEDKYVKVWVDHFKKTLAGDLELSQVKPDEAAIEEKRVRLAAQASKPLPGVKAGMPPV